MEVGQLFSTDADFRPSRPWNSGRGTQVAKGPLFAIAAEREHLEPRAYSRRETHGRVQSMVGHGDQGLKQRVRGWRKGDTETGLA